MKYICLLISVVCVQAISLHDYNGVVAHRAANSARWQPVTEAITLHEADWLRTAKRGANACATQFPDGEVILGPGSLAEIAADCLHLLQGEAAVSGDVAVDRQGCGNSRMARILHRQPCQGVDGAATGNGRWPQHAMEHRLSQSDCRCT